MREVLRWMGKGWAYLKKISTRDAISTASTPVDIQLRVGRPPQDRDFNQDSNIQRPPHPNKTPSLPASNSPQGRNTSRKTDCRRSGRVGRFNTSSRRCSSPLHKNHVYSAVTETRNWSRQFCVCRRRNVVGGGIAWGVPLRSGRFFVRVRARVYLEVGKRWAHDGMAGGRLQCFFVSVVFRPLRSFSISYSPFHFSGSQTICAADGARP